MKIYQYATLSAIIILLLLPSLAVADSVGPPQAYIKHTSDGQHLFVMMGAYDSNEKDPLIYQSTDPGEEGNFKRYKRSGLYRADGSSMPLWTVDWYSSRVSLLSDAIHMVLSGSWAISPKSEAVSFFANGELIRSYTVDELTAFPHLMRHTAPHFTWRAMSYLDEEAKSYTIVTEHNERYIFDVTTGEILWSYSPFQSYLDQGLKTYTIVTNRNEKYIFDVTTGEIKRSYFPFWQAFQVILILEAIRLVWRRRLLFSRLFSN